MAMSEGNASCSSGMSQELYDNLIAQIGSLPAGFDATLMKKTLYAICLTIVNHLKTNMEIAGVSSVVAQPIPVQVDPGTHIGATTATGTAAQSGSVHPT